MAIDAGSDVVLGELASMRVFMALFTLERRSRKVSLDQLGLHVGRLVAIDASGRAMSSHEREFGLRVIEANQIVPLFCGVAGFAAHRSAVRAQLLLPFCELSLMRILVAGFAGQILPMIENDGLGYGIGIFRLFVTISTRYCNMTAGQDEARIFMPL